MWLVSHVYWTWKHNDVRYVRAEGVSNWWHHLHMDGIWRPGTGLVDFRRECRSKRRWSRTASWFTSIQRLGRGGGASKRDGERIASMVDGKLEKSGLTETKRKKWFKKEVCNIGERYGKMRTEKRNGHLNSSLKGHAWPWEEWGHWPGWQRRWDSIYFFLKNWQCCLTHGTSAPFYGQVWLLNTHVTVETQLAYGILLSLDLRAPKVQVV